MLHITPERIVSPIHGHHTSGETLFNQRPTRARNRVLLSCVPCRERKLKCDRKDPCDDCIKATKRGDPISCQYAPSLSRILPTAESSVGQDIVQSLEETQHPVKRLEELVRSLRAERH
jgi:hypothetical protein